MNKMLFLIGSIILPLQIVFCQHQNPYNLISTAGGKTSSSANIMIFSVGESVIGKCSNASNVEAMGFWSIYQSDILTSVEENDNPIPTVFKLEQNYPNPFNPSTIIKFAVPERSNVIIKIYNITGEEIKTLVNEEKERGWYEIKFNSNGLASGIYLYRMQAGSYVNIKKMILLR
ncbi:MAG: T9SS type A sorting domain-containing protein [Ignavibacterium sp.]